MCIGHSASFDMVRRRENQLFSVDSKVMNHQKGVR